MYKTDKGLLVFNASPGDDQFQGALYAQRPKTAFAFYMECMPCNNVQHQDRAAFFSAPSPLLWCYFFTLTGTFPYTFLTVFLHALILTVRCTIACSQGRTSYWHTMVLRIRLYKNQLAQGDKITPSSKTFSFTKGDAWLLKTTTNALKLFSNGLFLCTLMFCLHVCL